MTRDAMVDSMDMANSSQNTFRRRTMATSEMREFLSTKDAEPNNFGMQTIPESPTPSTPTRRMSIGDSTRIYDWEEPRFNIQGFVVDYFTYRIAQNGLDWYDAPALPDGVQKEHEMMRSLGTIFEKRHMEMFENFSEQLLAVPKISFSLYQEVVQTVGNSPNTPCPMSYGRLIGLISFGGMVAARMMESAELQGQVRNLLMYTSLFIKTRIRQSWKEHNRSWADFMKLGQQMKEDYEKEKDAEEGKRLKSWSIIGASVIAVIVCGRIIFSFK
ncbi:hypothetical protein B9Z55_009559 [Caenorhabditis nigoni]|uniref:Apoptosis regulator ced-9 n=1 Tax=Caenorhabditis nigoni TaxID=1611254 RepID=A0A2G5USR3_9PELO|nr:hypothetical protein B9Z55_009559 [Caenorhabditis nigoni]